MESDHKMYLGDAVYAYFDGFSIVLTTEDGVRATNTIVMEPDVVSALVTFVERIQSRRHDPRIADEAKS
jgi:hypothetical protein